MSTSTELYFTVCESDSFYTNFNGHITAPDEK